MGSASCAVLGIAPCQRLQSGAGSSASSSPAPAKPEIQKRACLQVKDGGFDLGSLVAANPGKLDDFFEFDKKAPPIGQGGFGVVRRGRDKRTGILRAVKTINKKAVKDKERLREEIDIMKILDHPNILRLVESFEDKRQINLVMELCDGGELLERIVQQGTLTESVASKCVRQMFLAVNYLHQNRIMHRDIKPENWLLVTKQEVGVAPIRLIDFGISKRFTPGVLCTTKSGTPNYVAPEVLLGKYDEKADVWSLGVICYLMLSGALPFAAKSLNGLLDKVKAAVVTTDGAIWRRVTDQGRGLIRKLLEKTPSSRLSGQQALQHPWMEQKKESGASARAEVGTIEVSRLKAFSQMHNLKRAALTIVATQASHVQIDALREMFMGMDQDSNGTLSIEELKDGLSAAGIPLPADIDQVLALADTDGSGVMDYSEFLAATLDRKICHQESVVWAAFKRLDKDNSGYLEKEEVLAIIEDSEVKEAMHLDQGDTSSVFAQVDLNGDGVIDFEEFFAMMTEADKKKDRKSKAWAVRKDNRKSIGMGVLAPGAQDTSVQTPPVARNKSKSPR